MIGKELWKSIKAHVDCDNALESTEKEIIATEKKISQTNEQIKLIKKLTDDHKHQITEGQKTLHFYELQAQTLEDDETKKRKQLSAIKNQKEYKALEKEIESIAQERRDLDDLMLRSYHQTDLDKNKIAQEKGQNEQKTEQLTQEVEAHKAVLIALEEKEEALEASRQDLAEKIPSDWLTRYERMKHNVTDPIVPALNGCCSACFYAILHQDITKLKKSGLLPCRNCYRILYYDQEEATDAANASF